MTQTFDVGCFVRIPFGAGSKQVAHVVGFARDGRVKVRAWNSNQHKWMPGTRLLDPALAELAQAAHLPAPPAVPRAAVTMRPS